MAAAADNDAVVLLEIDERIATITLNRPDARNALNGEVLRLLPHLLRQADEDDGVDVVILTGADPAFCAGLDLKELGSTGGNLTRAEPASDPARVQRPFPPLDKPLIGAINGAAITGGLEIALNCDFLIASELAKFGDTHARVGVMPGWGLTVLLSQAIGVRRAREMSFTGNFLSAHDALHWGLVNHVVSPAELMPAARRLAREICGNDRAGVRQIRRTYAEINLDQPAWEIEARDSTAWRRAMFAPETVAARRDDIMQRGRGQ
jgi:enoyl-CoA hydratase